MECKRYYSVTGAAFSINLCFRNTTAAATGSLTASTLLSRGHRVAKKRDGKAGEIFFSVCIKLQQRQAARRSFYHSGVGQSILTVSN